MRAIFTASDRNGSGYIEFEVRGLAPLTAGPHLLAHEGTRLSLRRAEPQRHERRGPSAPLQGARSTAARPHQCAPEMSLPATLFMILFRLGGLPCGRAALRLGHSRVACGGVHRSASSCRANGARAGQDAPIKVYIEHTVALSARTTCFALDTPRTNSGHCMPSDSAIGEGGRRGAHPEGPQ